MAHAKRTLGLGAMALVVVLGAVSVPAALGGGSGVAPSFGAGATNAPVTTFDQLDRSDPAGYYRLLPEPSAAERSLTPLTVYWMPREVQRRHRPRWPRRPHIRMPYRWARSTEETRCSSGPRQRG